MDYTKRESILTITFFGTLWGMLEAVVGGYMHFFQMAATGPVMMSIGAFCLTSAVLKEKTNAARCLLVGTIAAALKFLSIPFYGFPVFSRSILHPVTSIMAQSLVMAVVLHYAFRKMKEYDISVPS